MNRFAHTEHAAVHPHDGHADAVFGFWVYLMTDLVLFASLFATFVVLRGNTFGGPSGGELFSLPFVLVETIILLLSSFTSGLAVIMARDFRKRAALLLLGTTLLLGTAFVALEISEFGRLIAEGNDWQRSAFLSAYFTLVGTHGLHVSVGILWLLVLTVSLVRRGFTPPAVHRLFLASLFWHFLDIVWIFIFTIVYLIGAI